MTSFDFSPGLWQRLAFLTRLQGFSTKVIFSKSVAQISGKILVYHVWYVTTEVVWVKANLFLKRDDFSIFFSVVLLTQLATPYLEKTKGNIINVSSIGGFKAVGIQIFIQDQLTNLILWFFSPKIFFKTGKFV